MNYIYVIGHRETGGVWLPNFGYYQNYEDADKVAKLINCKVFTLSPGNLATPLHPDCEGAYLEKNKCTRCGYTFEG